jgi:hypothetical protein
MPLYAHGILTHVCRLTNFRLYVLPRGLHPLLRFAIPHLRSAFDETAINSIETCEAKNLSAILS